MENLQYLIKSYILKEISEIGKPKNINQVYKFADLESTIDLLFDLLNVDVHEESLQRVKLNFFTHLPKILDFDESELPVAIEGLATNFEPFLKLIAYHKYGDTDFWHSDGKYSEGLIKTTLNNLIQGTINNKFSTPEDIPVRKIPEPLLKYSGVQRAVVEYVRKELRNAVHNAKAYSRMELLYNSHLVLSCYLFAVEDNSLFLKKKFQKEYKYLQKILSTKSYINLDKVYVELFGQENFKDIDVMGSEIIEEDDLVLSLDTYEKLSGFEDQDINQIEEETIKERRVDSIINIAQDIKHLVVIGSPGSGKTTTLLNLMYKNCQEILEGKKDKKIPFFINANEYGEENTFTDILARNFNKEWIENQLESGRLQIIIDGINEVSESLKVDAYKEIKFWLTNFPQNEIILSERKINFERRFDIPVFELQNLDEEQISSFIKKYSGHNYSSIWEQLRGNPNMLKLASSPLMLKMILTVSRSGKIPKNRGLLYQVFLNSIFQREKSKQQQIRRDTKVDVLAFIAFTMRKLGFVSVPISKFKTLIQQKLKSQNSTIPTNAMYSELLDNLIIKETQNENVSFFHETYQEYFCALEIKYEFEIDEEIQIDFRSNIWFEALLICNEIMVDNSRGEAFFKYLFRGGQIRENSKYLFDFDANDFNEDITIPCKIAYSVKSVKPEIYSLAEKSLKNYTVLWKYFYYKKNIEIIPLEKLFSSIASLNSPTLFKYISENLGWVYIWLYCEYEEKNNFNSRFEKDKIHSQIFTKLTSAVCENLPEFRALYEILDNSPHDFIFSKSITWNLDVFKKKLISTQPDNQLKDFYRSKFDLSVFLSVLRSDITAIIDYKFSNNTNTDNIYVLRCLVRNHYSKEQGQDIILNEIKTLQYGTLMYQRILKRYSEYNLFDSIIALMEFLYEYKPNDFRSNMAHLQAIPWNLLSSKIQQIFLANTYELEVPFHSLQMEVEKSYFILNREHKDFIESREKFIINDKFEIEVIARQPHLYENNHSLVLKAPRNQIDPITSIGTLKIIINNENFSFRYSGNEREKENTFKFFLLDSPGAITRKKIDWQNCPIRVNDSLNWTFLKFEENIIESKNELKILFKVIGSETSPTIPNVGFLKELSFSIDLNFPAKYHPFQISSRPKIMEDLKKSIGDQKTINFIVDLGLTYYFHQSLNNVHYGIITQLFNNWVRIYSFQKAKYIERLNFNISTSVDLINKIVVIEKNDLIFRTLTNKDEWNTTVFLESEIVYLDENKKEGFIMKKEKNGESSDYFFNFGSCDFVPSIGDTVKFVPALNAIKGYEKEPIALKIRKLDSNRCTILETFYNSDRTELKGKAINVKTGENLYFRTSTESELGKLLQRCESDDIFNYYTHKEKSLEKLRHVKLVPEVKKSQSIEQKDIEIMTKY